MAAPMDARSPSPSTRRALILLVVVAGALTAGAIFERDRALERSYEDAQARAELYTATVLRAGLSPADLAAPLDDARRQALLAELQTFVLGDPSVIRVRLWSSGGTLLFSSDPADPRGAESSDPIIAQASSGAASSRLGVGSMPRGTASSVPTRVFETFVPLHLRGATEVGGVAEIEQLASVVESRAEDPWWSLQVGASAATGLLAVLAFVSVARGARPSAKALQDARPRAKTAEALTASTGDLTAVKEQLSTAERDRERAVERAESAEARADAAEDRARTTAELATAAERRIDALEARPREVASSGVEDREAAEVEALRRELAAATARAEDLERRLAGVEASARASGTSDDLLAALEERVTAAEARAAEADQRLRAFEDESAEHGSAFRHTLGVRAAGRKFAAPTPSERQAAPTDPENELRKAISRGLRGPLTRAAGLTLSLQGAVGSAEGKSVVRQLSSSLRRLDQLTADLHDVHRIMDGSLPMNRRSTDIAALLTTTLEEADQLHEDRLVRLDAERLHATVDPARIRQIVEGMLEAARERTRAGAAIVVRARTTERGIWISVEDDNKTPATVGPEMSLAARLAELHGTEIVAEGSSFRIVLPPEEA